MGYLYCPFILVKGLEEKIAMNWSWDQLTQVGEEHRGNSIAAKTAAFFCDFWRFLSVFLPVFCCCLWIAFLFEVLLIPEGLMDCLWLSWIVSAVFMILSFFPWLLLFYHFFEQFLWFFCAFFCWSQWFFCGVLYGRRCQSATTIASTPQYWEIIGCRRSHDACDFLRTSNPRQIQLLLTFIHLDCKMHLAKDWTIQEIKPSKTTIFKVRRCINVSLHLSETITSWQSRCSNSSINVKRGILNRFTLHFILAVKDIRSSQRHVFLKRLKIKLVFFEVCRSNLLSNVIEEVARCEDWEEGRCQSGGKAFVLELQWIGKKKLVKKLE